MVEELPFIVRGKVKNGTDCFIRFAIVGVVKDGKRFTLNVLLVTSLSYKVKVVRKLMFFCLKNLFSTPFSTINKII
ncbi:MAG: hypothetical protein ACQXXF_01460 [Thermoplasmatota archaeon]|jgi:hypothetical protein